MHHPPFACGIAHMDAIRLNEGEPALREIIARNPQVERILCGHHHRPIHVRYAGTIATAARESRIRWCWISAQRRSPSSPWSRPPTSSTNGIEGTGLISHGGYVERYPGPYPFLRDQITRRFAVTRQLSA
jgi:3',5'-cyclic AMP phosphodiesterase CpdA